MKTDFLAILVEMCHHYRQANPMLYCSGNHHRHLLLWKPVIGIKILKIMFHNRDWKTFDNVKDIDELFTALGFKTAIKTNTLTHC